MKAAIIILSDPNSGSEESNGRVFNALAAAYDFKQRGHQVSLVFQGTGTRWASRLTQKDHPFHALYASVKDTVSGVSCGCADVFGARADAEESGFVMLTDNVVEGTSGLPALARLAEDGYTLLTF